MNKIFALASAVVLTTGFSAWAAEGPATPSPAPAANHSAEAMTNGSHQMTGNKHEQMSNKTMPGMNPKCYNEAELAKMPADHRAACHRNN